jgi:hypothetical protein
VYRLILENGLETARKMGCKSGAKLSNFGRQNQLKCGFILVYDYFSRNSSNNVQQIYMENIEELKSLLSIPKNIVITTHRNPDGDAIGSSLAYTII